MKRSWIVDVPGLRLDKFLAEKLAPLSRAHVQGLIARGLVTVDGRAGRASEALRGGERVAVAEARSSWSEGASIDGWVLHEDAALLVLRKPAGLLMHPLGVSWLTQPEAALEEPEPNLAGLLQLARPEVLVPGMQRCGLVHRLDRQTSGVLLVAKTPDAQEELLAAFKERRVTKIYRAVVRGEPAEGEARVEAPIGRNPGHRRVVVTPFGKTAETSFRVLGRAPGAALVEARPLTGRTHQIRAHLALIGHPVMGDVEFDKPAAGAPAAPRLMLHAYSIAFEHPGTGRPAAFRCDPPADFRDFWASLGGAKKPARRARRER